jgi:transcriptional regulator with XRE-family HTH domain
MEMKVDSTLIRSEREKRAWSQEHLAEVAGLGLRTVQRIESTGAAGYESVRALAAVLEIDVALLRVTDDPAAPPATGEPQIAAALEPVAPPSPRRLFKLRPAPPWIRPLYTVAALLAVGGALLIARSGFADPIQLDVGVSMNGQTWDRRMVVDEGTLVRNVNDVTLDDMLRLEVVPTIVKGSIMLTMKLLVREGDRYVLVGEPRLLTKDGEQAAVRFMALDGNSFEITIKPQSNPPEIAKQLREIR